MRRRLLTSKHWLFLAFALMLGAGLFPQSLASGLWHYPRHMLLLALSPAQHPLHSLADQIRTPLTPKVELGPISELENNYMELLSFNAKLQQELREANDFVMQLAQLRNLRKASEILLPARVTLSTQGLAIRSLTLVVGTKKKVQQGMVVAAGYNLVGRVASVGSSTSTVRLINSPGTYLAARLVPPVNDQSPRQTVAHLEVSDNGKFFFARGDINEQVKIGDLAFLADDRWPLAAQGLIIGQVTAIDQDEMTPLLRTRIKIEPLRSLMHLGQVLVIEPQFSENALGGVLP
ncbi:MAG: rod shape-determining protein MreC [Phycisphaeraceae bacterium]|nr:rod shape-determining protein MreC [Phycisphaeraceae bacterium]